MGLLVLTRQNAHTHTHKRCISQAYSLMQSTKECTVQHTMISIVTVYFKLLMSKDKVAQISTNLICIVIVVCCHYNTQFFIN